MGRHNKRNHNRANSRRMRQRRIKLNLKILQPGNITMPEIQRFLKLWEDRIRCHEPEIYDYIKILDTTTDDDKDVGRSVHH